MTSPMVTPIHHPACQSQGRCSALHSTCPALVVLFAHVGIMSKEDSHRLQVPQGHSQLQRGSPSGVLLFNVVLSEMGHDTQYKARESQSKEVMGLKGLELLWER